MDSEDGSRGDANSYGEDGNDSYDCAGGYGADSGDRGVGLEMMEIEVWGWR